MRLIYLSIFCISILLSAASYGDDRVISLTFPKVGYPPYVIAAQQDKRAGILVDVLKVITEELGYHLKIVNHPEVRGQLMVANGRVDLFPSAPKWVDTPRKYLWTAPVVFVADHIILPSEQKLTVKTLDDIEGWRLGTLTNLQYPSLAPLFTNKRISRVDGRSLNILLKNLTSHRIDAIVMDQNVFRWSLHNNQNYQPNDFNITNLAIDPVGYGFMVTKTTANQMFVLSFNRVLRIMKKDGRLAEIFKNYK